MNRPSYLLFKKCTKCGEIKHISKFSKNKQCKYGVSSRCKECDRKYRENNKDKIREYREENKDKIREQKIKWKENNKEHVKKQRHEYYENNKEDILKKNKKYREEHKEDILKNKKKYREEHKEYYREYRKEYYENNKEIISEKSKIRYENNKEYIKEYQKEYKINNPNKTFNQQSKRRFKENTQGDGINKIQWFEMMEFFQWTCAYSGEYLGGDNKDRRRTIDHIISLNNGGEHEIWNCVPMLKSYNSSKHDKNLLEWYLQQEYFDIDRLTKIYEWRIYAYEKWYKGDE